VPHRRHPDDQGHARHAANFGVKSQEHCTAQGVACELVYPGAPGVKHETPTDYLIATLKAPAQTKQNNPQ